VPHEDHRIEAGHIEHDPEVPDASVQVIEPTYRVRAPAATALVEGQHPAPTPEGQDLRLEELMVPAGPVHEHHRHPGAEANVSPQEPPLGDGEPFLLGPGGYDRCRRRVRTGERESQCDEECSLAAILSGVHMLFLPRIVVVQPCRPQ